MPRNQIYRSSDLGLNADLKILQALKTISDYRPINPAYTVEALQARYAAQQAADEAERKTQAAFSAAHKVAVAADWDFHDAMMGVKYQVIAQYGPDSDQVVLLGLKKKSERKAPTRAAKLEKTVQKNVLKTARRPGPRPCQGSGGRLFCWESRACKKVQMRLPYPGLPCPDTSCP